MPTLEFNWEGIIFQVRELDGRFQFRDKAHWGGPWTNAEPIVKDTSVDFRFRQLVRETILKMKMERKQNV